MLHHLAILSVVSRVLDAGILPKLSAHIKQKLIQKIIISHLLIKDSMPVSLHILKDFV